MLAVQVYEGDLVEHREIHWSEWRKKLVKVLEGQELLVLCALLNTLPDRDKSIYDEALRLCLWAARRPGLKPYQVTKIKNLTGRLFDELDRLGYGR